MQLLPGEPVAEPGAGLGLQVPTPAPKMGSRAPGDAIAVGRGRKTGLGGPPAPGLGVPVLDIQDRTLGY